MLARPNLVLRDDDEVKKLVARRSEIDALWPFTPASPRPLELQAEVLVISRAITRRRRGLRAVQMREFTDAVAANKLLMPRNVWSWINDLLAPSKRSRPRGVLTPSPAAIPPQVWIAHFQAISVQRCPAPSYLTLYSFVEREVALLKISERYNHNCSDECTRPFVIGEVEEAIRSLPNGKAPGVDAMPYEAVKTVSAEIAPFLLSLFNRVWDESVVPQEWLLALINPIPKGVMVAPDLPSSYRPISLDPRHVPQVDGEAARAKITGRRGCVCLSTASRVSKEFLRE